MRRARRLFGIFLALSTRSSFSGSAFDEAIRHIFDYVQEIGILTI